MKNGNSVSGIVKIINIGGIYYNLTLIDGKGTFKKSVKYLQVNII